LGSRECDGYGGGGEVNREEVRKLNCMCGGCFESWGVYFVGKGWSMVRDLVGK